VCRKWNYLADDRAIFDRKQSIAIAVVGPTNVGKTSLIGQLLVRSGVVDEREEARVLETARGLNRESMRLAMLVDRQKDELERGFTIDSRRVQIEGSRFQLELISGPGNLHYFKNLATTITQGDAALIVVDARGDNFTRTRSTLRQMMEMLKIVGTTQFVVAVNKMDAVGFAEDAFNEAVERVQALFQEVRIPWGGVTVVPVSAMSNLNVLGYVGREFKWYTGPTVYGALDALNPPARPLHKPLRITIDKVYSVKGVGTVACGQVIQGIVRVEQPVKLAPKGIVTEIKSMHLAVSHQSVSVAYPGEYVGLNLRGVSKSDCGARKLGTITGHLPELDAERIDAKPAAPAHAWAPRPPTYSRGDLRRILRATPLYAASGFTAQVAVWNPQGTIRHGFNAVMHIHNAQLPARLEEVISVERRNDAARASADTGGLSQRNMQIARGEVVTARFSVDRVALETAADCGKLGRFIMREGRTVIGGGIITEVTVDPNRNHLDKK
jgi:elongation factor 1-alpha